MARASRAVPQRNTCTGGATELCVRRHSRCANTTGDEGLPNKNRAATSGRTCGRAESPTNATAPTPQCAVQQQQLAVHALQCCVSRVLPTDLRCFGVTHCAESSCEPEVGRNCRRETFQAVLKPTYRVYSARHGNIGLEHSRYAVRT